MTVNPKKCVYRGSQMNITKFDLQFKTKFIFLWLLQISKANNLHGIRKIKANAKYMNPLAECQIWDVMESSNSQHPSATIPRLQLKVRYKFIYSSMVQFIYWFIVLRYRLLHLVSRLTETAQRQQESGSRQTPCFCHFHPTRALLPKGGSRRKKIGIGRSGTFEICIEGRVSPFKGPE